MATDPELDAAIGGTTDRTRLRRIPELGHYDRATIYAIVDAAPLCHVGFLLDGAPLVLPTIHARHDDDLILHGSRSSRMLRNMTGPAGTCITVTHFDGLVLARSVFNHTMSYRSAVLFGHPMLIEDMDDKRESLRLLSERTVPGRWLEARQPNERELNLTTVLRMPIEEASAKVSLDPPEDEPEDLDFPVWAGLLPSIPEWGEPVTDHQGTGAGAGLAVSPSVQRLYRPDER